MEGVFGSFWDEKGFLRRRRHLSVDGKEVSRARVILWKLGRRWVQQTLLNCLGVRRVETRVLGVAIVIVIVVFTGVKPNMKK